MVQNLHLLSCGNEAFAERRNDFSALVEKLERLASLPDARVSARAKSLLFRLRQYSAKVILVGQVKAGKSSLTNVLAGSPGLLPADVNPWTSVVTSINIRNEVPQNPPEDEIKARFTFLDKGDWDTLTRNGGRLGELANRAGAPDEMADIERQIQEMRAKTERRLGKHFEMLLGQTHDYGYVDTELMERYVSLGDDYDIDGINAKTGCFADITKSAELFLDVPHYAMPMQVCDTPGVNDTFMMREQITIRSLRGAELCVVVLAAHQALTTVDIALMRIISTLEKRQIVLFVNRVDELENPAEQIPEIRDSIRDTLRSHQIETEVPIIFGSAMWAEAALTGDMGAMPDTSLKVLETFLNEEPDMKDQTLEETVWHFSGLPSLLTTLAERISQGSALHAYERIRRRTHNLASETKVMATAQKSSADGQPPMALNGEVPASMIKDIAVNRGQELGSLCEQLHGDLLARMERAQEDFVHRATTSLVNHFEMYGEQGTWTYEPAGLRMLHRSAYASFARQFKSRVGQLLGTTAQEVETLYRESMAGHLDDLRIEPPVLPRVPPPVSLGKTIALDLQGNWWRRWWQQRRGYETSASQYAELIRAEIQTVISEVIQSQVPELLEECRSAYNEFMHEHLEMVETLANGDKQQPAKSADAQRQSDHDAAMCSEMVRDLDKMSAVGEF